MRFSAFTGLRIFLAISLLFAGADANRAFDYRKKDTAAEILKKVSDRLHNVKNLKYTYRRELNYASEGYKNLLSAESFLDFTSVDKIIGVRYQFENEKTLLIFNGSEKFELDKKGKLMTINNKPAKDAFEGVSCFYNSPVTLRNALPVIASDETIPKTVTGKAGGNQSFYEIEFILDKKTLNAFGSYFPITLDRKIKYRITVNKNDYLPVEVLQTNNANRDFIKTSFDNIEADTTAAGAPKELTWYFSSYLNEYKEEKMSAKNSLLVKSGQPAPDWTLPVFDGNRTISPSQFKGRLVLLEFWISHCGYCIAAVAPLNEIYDRYKNKDFKLFAVNAHDSKEVIKIFQRNNRPVYEILNSGEEVTGIYGVEAFPTVVLIDKKGNVIYAGGFDKESLVKLIDKNLR
ncbi:MAG TPA: TlpA disulfide reductase family protein [Pyrinomonadaceae bacterium]|jgi:thiol-disulfide isomerase/thioredoxin